MEPSGYFGSLNIPGLYQLHVFISITIIRKSACFLYYIIQVPAALENPGTVFRFDFRKVIVGGSGKLCQALQSGFLSSWGCRRNLLYRTYGVYVYMS